MDGSRASEDAYRARKEIHSGKSSQRTQSEKFPRRIKSKLFLESNEERESSQTEKFNQLHESWGKSLRLINFSHMDPTDNRHSAAAIVRSFSRVSSSEQRINDAEVLKLIGKL